MFIILQKDEARTEFTICKVFKRKDIRDIKLLPHALRDITRQRIIRNGTHYHYVIAQHDFLPLMRQGVLFVLFKEW